MNRLMLALATLLLAALPAAARTGLKSSDPAEGARVSDASRITLHFSGALEPARSGAELIGPSGKAVPVATAVGLNAITLLPFRLKPGRYHVDWHSVGQDKSKAQGRIAFTVAP